MKKLIFMAITCLFLTPAFALNGITGLWKTIDDETGQAKSIVQIYEYKGQYYGRVIELLKNKKAKAKIPGNPNIIGLDIIWNMQADGQKLNDGTILDPVKGKTYGCEIWRKGKNLIVRGKIAFLGRNQTWLPVNKNDIKVDVKENIVPKIPRV